MDDVRLIASDLDRTLLTGDGELPPGFFDTVERLNSHGIIFVPASGRPLPTLHHMFPADSNGFAFISDNGAVAAYNGEILFESVLPPDAYLTMTRATFDKTDAYPMVCGLHATYVTSAAKSYADVFHRFYKNIVYINDYSLIEEDAVKFSAYFPAQDARGAYEAMYEPTFGKEFSVTLGGPPWVDIMNLGISKGAAIQAMAKHLGLDRDQLMAFGDTFNDLEMLDAVGHSYAVANADQEVLDRARFTAQSNEDHGVMQVLDTLLNRRIAE